LNGYDKISETLPDLTTKPSKHHEAFLNEEWARETATTQGFYEARNYNFVSGIWQSKLFDAKQFKNLGLDVEGEPVKVQNPLSEETSVMRQSLCPSLISNLLHNYHYGNSTGRLFEVGYVFAKTNNTDSPYKQNSRLGLIAWGQNQNLWNKTDRPVIYDLKSAIDGIAQKLRANIQWRTPKPEDVPSFVHPTRVTTLFFEGKVIGFIGSLHPIIREENKIRSDVAIGEINLSLLMRGQPKATKMKKLSKFQSVERDFALLMPTDLAVNDVLKEVEKLAQPLIQNVEVFDIFKGQGVPEGQQSVAIRMVLQSNDNTLTEADLTQTTEKVLKGLTQKFPVKLR